MPLRVGVQVAFSLADVRAYFTDLAGQVDWLQVYAAQDKTANLVDQMLRLAPNWQNAKLVAAYKCGEEVNVTLETSAGDKTAQTTYYGKVELYRLFFPAAKEAAAS